MSKTNRSLPSYKPHDLHIQAHASKHWPAKPDPNRIVEAFGARKCPKLVEQMQFDNVDVRIAALAALAQLLKNPQDIVSCISARVLRVLVSMLSDEELLVRVGSSRALAIGCVDPNFRRHVQEEKVLDAFKPPLDDDDDELRYNMYEALRGMSVTTWGAAALVEAGYLGIFTQKVEREPEIIQEVILKTLHNCVKTEKAVNNALTHEAVEVCIRLLSSDNDAVRKEAAAALGLLCFEEAAKVRAIEHKAVPILSVCLVDPEWPVRAAAAGALMNITTTDEGKKQVYDTGGVHKLMQMLGDDQDVVVVNALKGLTNATVNPDARRTLKEDVRFLIKLDTLVTKAQSPMIQKHAVICKSAVLWQP